MRLDKIKVTNGINRFSNVTTIHKSFQKACEQVNLILSQLKQESFLSPMEFIEFAIKFSNGYEGKITYPIRSVEYAIPVNDLKQVITASLEREIINNHYFLFESPRLFEWMDENPWRSVGVDILDVIKELTEFLNCLKEIDDSTED